MPTFLFKVEWMTPLAVGLAVAALAFWMGREKGWVRRLLGVGLQLAIGAAAWGAVFGLLHALPWIDRKVKFDHPEYLYLLLIGQPIVLLGVWSLELLDAPRRWTAIAIRLAVLLLVVLILTEVQWVRRQETMTIMALMDQSRSVTRLSRYHAEAGAEAKDATVKAWANRYIQKASDKMPSDDQFGSIAFGGTAGFWSLPSAGAGLKDEQSVPVGEGTDPAQAIRMALSRAVTDSSPRLLLVWDGNLTKSIEELRGALREAKAAGVPIDVLPVEYQIENEVAIDSLYTPAEAHKGQTITLSVRLSATRPTAGVLRLFRDGEQVTQPEGIPISEKDSRWVVQRQAKTVGVAAGAKPSTVDRYICDVGLEIGVEQVDVNRFQAQFFPKEGTDQFTDNNKAESFTLVHGKGKVLVVDNVGDGQGVILPKALESRGIECEVVPPSGIPGNLREMVKYDAVVLQNVPADDVGPAKQRLLETYVRRMGGGLVMIGGPDSFAAGGWTNTPIDRILPVECQIPSQAVLPSGALVIVLDRSGSMGVPVSNSMHNKMELANEAAVLALQGLYPQDLVGVIAFDSSPQWVYPLQENKNPTSVARAIRSITPNGGTNIYPAVEEAVNALKDKGTDDAAVKHIILLTDGRDGVLSQAYHKIIGVARKNNITLTTIAVGGDADTELLKQLAVMGGGKPYDATNPNQLPQIFIKEVRIIRKNLVREGEFLPTLQNVLSPITQGIKSAPPLKGLILTGPKNHPQVIMPMLGPEGVPLFAHWQVELGRVAAFTSDATNRWSEPWLTSGVYADFWSRCVRTIARPSENRAHDLVTNIKGDMLEIRLDTAGATDPNNADRTGAATFTNFLNVGGAVIRPDGTTVNVTLEQTGPGRYEARVPAAEAGNYIVYLQAQGDHGESANITGGVSKLPGDELRDFTSNLVNLKEVADITGGRLLPADPAGVNLFDHRLARPSQSFKPAWALLLVTLLVLFLADVACRRIAWDLAATWDWVRGRVDAVLGLFKTRRVDSEATMAALKRRAAATDQALAGSPVLAPAAATVKVSAPRPTASAERKFEADPAAVVEEDFAAAVGAAETNDRPAPIPKAGVAAAGVNEGPTTSRLLDAKRRAQEKLEKK